MVTSTRAQGALDDGSQAASSRRQRALAGAAMAAAGSRGQPGMQRSGMHMRGHAESHGERDPAQGVGPASRVPSNIAASSGSSPEAAPAARNRAPAVAWAVAACWRASAARSA
ncbi:hypothetical protein WJ970_27345 [Achromobacter xylosoxidans]